MVITNLGEGSFRVQSGNFSLVVDSANDRMKPNITLATTSPFPPEKPTTTQVIGPGEYEIDGATILGIQLKEESNQKLIRTMYKVTIEDIALLFPGGLSTIPDGDSVERLGDIDIMFVPAGKPYIESSQAAKFVKQLEPAFVIPSHTTQPKALADELGQKAEPQEKLTLKRKEVLEAGEGTKIVWLKS